MWYVSQFEEWIGVSDLLLGNQYALSAMYMHE